MFLLYTLQDFSFCSTTTPPKKLYYPMVYSFITYARKVLAKSCKTQIKRAESVLDKCVKQLSINNSSKKSDYLNLNLFQLDEVYKFFVLYRRFMYMTNINNNFFKEKARIDSIMHSYSSRSASSWNYNIPLVNSSITYKSSITMQSNCGTTFLYQ